MNPRQDILDRLRTIKPALQQEFPLCRMALFGSWARNEQTETSDDLPELEKQIRALQI